MTDVDDITTVRPGDRARPPGLTADEFETALGAFVSAVGAEHVAVHPHLDRYLDPYAFVDRGHRPSACVRPGSVDEVAATVRAAAAHGVALWTVSTGKNLGYGGAAPRLDGSVVVDLSRLDRILEVDDEQGYAIVEPGVTFMALHDHLVDRGRTLWASVPDIGWGSVIGNTLERGFGYTAHGDHSAFQCGLEVVLADGEVVRTGMGAQSGSPAWAAYRGGYGPSLDGLFQQSNLGIVTKMGIWLMPAPATAVVAMVKAPAETDLALLVDTIRPLMLDGTVQSSAVIGNAAVVASMITDRAAWTTDPGPLSDGTMRAIMSGLGLGWWNARFALYGPAALTEARLAVVEAAFAGTGFEIDVRRYAGDVDPATVHPADRAQLGIPSTDLLRMAAWRGGEPAHTDFSLVCPPTGRHAVTQMQLIRRNVEAAGFDYAGGFTLHGRHAIALALVSFDRSDPAHRARVTGLWPTLIAQAAQEGYAPYRSHLAWMDLIAEQYDFGDGAARRLTERLKAAVDPQGILSPGKQGIWPPALPGRAPSR